MPRSPAPKAPDADSVQRADALLREGLAASQSNDAHRALELFAQASQACPASGVPHFMAGSEFAALGEFEKAEAELASAVLLAPGLHIARYQLGLLQFSSGRAAAALVTWEPLFALDDTEPLGHFVCGFAALAQDDFQAAKSHFEDGLARNTANPALSSDIHKVLLGMRDAHARQPAASQPAAEADPAAAHVLVSNYGKYGTLH